LATTRHNGPGIRARPRRLPLWDAGLPQRAAAPAATVHGKSTPKPPAERRHAEYEAEAGS